MNATAHSHTIGTSEMANNLENFEIQQLREELRQQRLAHTEELSAIRHQSEQEPIERMIQRWNEYPAAVERADTAEAELNKARKEHALVSESLNTALKDIEQLEKRANHYKDQCDQVLDKNNANVAKANDTIERLQRQLREQDIQLKSMRAMNPEKLKKQVKRLQDKNKELTARNESLTKKHDQACKDKAQLAKELESTRQMNRDLGDSMDQMSRIMDGKEAEDKYGWKDDLWGVVGHEKNSTDQIYIEYIETGERRVFHRTKGIQRANAIPQYVKDMAQETVNRYNTIKKQIDELSA